MNRNNTSDTALQAQLDRLVSGDLSAPERRSLLAWLDEEPSRWRTCGLAFLEAQNWTEALETLEEDPRGSTAPPSTEISKNDRKKQIGERKSSLRLLALAASVLLALTSGIVIGRQWDSHAGPAIANIPHIADGPTASPMPGHENSKSGQVQLATVSLPTDLSPNVAALVQLPVKTASSDAAANKASSIPDHVRKQWERRGFELKEERRFLPARLADGREVVVPVNEVQVKYIGNQVY